MEAWFWVGLAFCTVSICYKIRRIPSNCSMCPNVWRATRLGWLGEVPLPQPYPQGYFLASVMFPFFVPQLFFTHSLSLGMLSKNLHAMLTSSFVLQLESIGVECDPDSTEEVDHTVFEPSIVCHWGLIYKTSTHIDISSLGEDFMKDVINDVYGKVKGTHSKLTMSIVRSSQLPKSLYSHSVYTPYIPQYMLGYQTPTDYSGAAG